MRYQMAADCAADVTLSVTYNLEGKLSSTSLTLFRALHQIALEAAEARGYSPGVSEVSLFAPVEAVALSLGVHRSTVWRSLPELRAAGLVDARTHFTSLRGRTRADGSVWAVRLRPVGGCKARVGYGDLKRQYRDLGGDIEAGKTVWAEMQRSKDNPSEGINLDHIRRWAIPSTDKTSIKFDRCTTPRRDLEAVLDAQHAPRAERSAAVNLAAQALAQALRDRGGMNFYRRLMWQLLRRSDATGEDYSYSVYLAAQRAAVDAREGFARRPGALFTARLKRAAWFGEVMRGPPVRVGGRPVEA